MGIRSFGFRRGDDGRDVGRQVGLASVEKEACASLIVTHFDQKIVFTRAKLDFDFVLVRSCRATDLVVMDKLPVDPNRNTIVGTQRKCQRSRLLKLNTAMEVGGGNGSEIQVVNGTIRQIVLGPFQIIDRLLVVDRCWVNECLSV